MNESASSLPDNWIPSKTFEEQNALYCSWVYLGDKLFTEPFFDSTISKCMSLAENSKKYKCVSSVNILPQWANEKETIEPTAIIFHVSRCGSTLISQMLGLQASNIILSEVPIFDELLRWGNKNNNLHECLPVLKAAIGIYGTKRNKDQEHLIIKADSWHVHFYKQLRQLYPGIPFILLYRRPDEVIRSQQKQRGMQAIPGLLEPEIFGFDRNRIEGMGLDEYMAKVIESYLQAFFEILQQDKLALPVNYNEGAMTIVKKISSATGIIITEKEMKAMQERSGFHAKYPEQNFNEEKLESPIPEYLMKAHELYKKVEAIRMSSMI